MSAFNRGDWVEAPSGSSGGPPPTEVLVDTFSNLITNGDMRIDQRASGTTGTTYTGVPGLAYPVDRFYMNKGDTGGNVKIAWAQMSDLPGFVRYIYWQSITGTTASQENNIVFAVEMQDLLNLFDSTASDRYMTLSFWAQCTLAGDYVVAFQNAARTKSYLASFNIPTIGLWYKIIITVPIDPDSSNVSYYPKTSGAVGLLIKIDMGSFTSSGVALDTWHAGNFTTTTTGILPNKRMVNSSNHTFRLAGVDLRPGQQAVQRFESHDQLLKCKRMCQPMDINYAPGAIGTFVIPMMFPVEMRILPPNVAVLAAGTLLNASAPTDVMVNGRCSTFQLTTSAANGSILGRRLLLSTGY